MKSKIFILILLFLVLASVGSAFASENNETTLSNDFNLDDVECMNNDVGGGDKIK